MGPGILIPLVLVGVVVPWAFAFARKRFKEGAPGDDAPPTAPAARLTSNVLRELPTPPWRVVYEIADERLGGVRHVLIGPPGIFALQTSLDPLPPEPDAPADARAIAAAAIARGQLDDALAACAMASDHLVVVHWGAHAGTGHSVESMPGMTAVDGRRLVEWASSLDSAPLSPAQVDLAWRTVVTAIGRPDPLT